MQKNIWSDADNFRVLLNHLHEGVLVIEKDVVVYANRAVHELLGYCDGGLEGMPYWSLIAPENRDLVIERHRRRLRGETVPETYEVLALRSDGETRVTLALNVGVLEGRNSVVVTLADLDHVERAKSELRTLQEELSQIVRKLPDIYYRTDMNGILTRLSPSVTSILGYEIEEVLGTPITLYYVDPDDRGGAIKKILEANGDVTRVEAGLRHKSGRVVWFSTNAYLVKDERGNAVGIEGLARDDTVRRDLEQELFRLSREDTLTGLCNRHYVFRRAEEEFQRSVRYGHNYTLLVLDLDHFKAINDLHGHHAGDEALRYFAQVSLENLRESDIMGRIGGEEFLVVLPETDTERGIIVAERICSALERTSLAFMGEEIRLTASIGIASRTNEDRSAEDMQIRADGALYEAKGAGRNCIRVHHVG